MFHFDEMHLRDGREKFHTFQMCIDDIILIKQSTDKADNECL